MHQGLRKECDKKSRKDQGLKSNGRWCEKEILEVIILCSLKRLNEQLKWH